MVESKPRPSTRVATPRSAAAPAPTVAKPSRLRWVLGWIVAPSLVVTLLFLGGVHVGARYPDMWLSRATLWMFGREAQLGPTNAAERQPMGHRMLLVALPNQPHSLELDVDAGTLADIAKTTDTSVDKLACEVVCEALWRKRQPERKFLGSTSCKLTPAAEAKPAHIACEAKVER